MEAGVASILYMLGLSGFFSSRAFLPAFLVSAVMRYGDHVPLLKNLDMVVDMSAAPGWLANDYVFGALAVLAICEMVADKIPEAQELLNLVDEYIKPIMAILTMFGILSQTDSEYLNQQLQQSAGLMQNVPAIVYGGIVFYFAHLRAQLIGYLTDADGDDDLGMRSLISWSEDLWVFFGFWLLLLAPFFMGVVVMMALALIWLIERYFRRRDEKSRVPCPSCTKEVHQSALSCPHCGTENQQPLRIGALGQSISHAVENREAHRLRLLEKKRCRVCATHLKKKCVEQACPACTAQPFPDRATAEQYVERLTMRLPQVLAISALMSLVPLLGFIIGVIYTRLMLIAPLKAYMPWHRSFVLKLLLKVLFLALALLQIIPLVGAGAVPLLALISYLVYRRSFMKALQRMEQRKIAA